MGAMLGTNGLVQKAECSRKGCTWRGGTEALPLPLPRLASPARSLAGTMGQGKAGGAATARAEPELQAQVFFPKFRGPLTGALCAPGPTHQLVPCPGCSPGKLRGCPTPPVSPAGFWGCWVLVTDRFLRVNSSNSHCNFGDFQGHNIHFSFSVARLVKSCPGCLYLLVTPER